MDGSGKVYVTGEETSTNFAVANPYQATNKGSFDAFVSKLDPSKSGAASLVYSSLLGANSDDYGQGIAVDGSGNAYVTGFTNANATIPFPVTAGAFQMAYATHYDAFVTKFNPAGGVAYSTLLGGGNDDRGLGIAVDASGNAAVIGSTLSSNFPLVNPSQATLGSLGNATVHDAFVTRLNPTGVPYYSTYLGGNNDDDGQAIAVDGAGNIYAAGLTNSSNFPTAAALQSSNAGGYDVFVTKLTDTGNHAPTLAPIGNQAVNLGNALSFTPAVTDPDLPAQTLTYSVVSGPAGASYSNGVFSWTPTSPGTYTVSIQVTDNGSPNLSATQTFTIVVNGTAAAAPATVSGNALQLDGNDYAITPNLAASMPANTNLTLEVWFKPSAAGIIVDELGQTAVNTGGSVFRDSQLEVLSSGEVRARVWNLNSITLGFVTFGAWHHAVLRYNSGTVTMDGFLDGVKSTAALTGTVRTSPLSSGFGQYYALGSPDTTNMGSGAYFNGQIDEFRVWNIARSDSQIVANTNLQAVR